MIDVMFYEVFDREEEALKRHLPKEVKADFTWQTIQEHGSDDPPAKVISIRTQSHIPDEWSSKLDGILTRSAGYDHLTDYLKKNKTDVLCGRLVDYCSRSVAEHAFLLTLASLRKIKVQLKQFEQFQRDNMNGSECTGKNLLIVGVGHIGAEIADIGCGLKMNVKGVDIVKNLKKFDYVSLEDGIVWADIIVCSAELTRKTKGLLNYNNLSKAKKGCVLINVSRGEITPQADLKRLLDEEILGALAQDVFEQEGVLAQKLREFVDDPSTRELLELSRRDNVIFTPHNAFNTQESLERKAKESADSLQKFFKSKTFLHPVTI